MLTMDEYIERESAMDVVRRTSGDYAAVFAELRRLPAADVAPVRHGRWENYDGMGYLVCSECRDVYIDEDWLKDGKWDYCPNCGARMDGDKNA